MQSPGAPVMRPITSAANAADPSWAVSTYGSAPARMASSTGSTLPLGTPNPWLTPAARRVATISSALSMASRTPRAAVLLLEEVVERATDVVGAGAVGGGV